MFLFHKLYLEDIPPNGSGLEWGSDSHEIQSVPSPILRKLYLIFWPKNRINLIIIFDRHRTKRIRWTSREDPLVPELNPSPDDAGARCVDAHAEKGGAQSAAADEAEESELVPGFPLAPDGRQVDGFFFSFDFW